MYCPKCGRNLNAAGSFCAVCGKNVSYLTERGVDENGVPNKLPVGGGKTFYCNYCGTDVYSKDSYCYQCGKKLAKQFFTNGRSRKNITYAIIAILFLASAWVAFKIVSTNTL